LKGHEFTRAKQPAKSAGALAPEVHAQSAQHFEINAEICRAQILGGARVHPCEIDNANQTAL
jgi:hypothetical protein